MPLQTISYCLAGLQGARTAIAIEDARGYHHLSPHHHLWTAGLKVIGVQCQQHHQCHHCQTGMRAPGIPDEVHNMGRPEPT